MGIIIVPGNPECPLCLKRMKKIITPRKQVLFACFEQNCMISINEKDPALNNWKIKEPPVCTICGKPMRAFFRVLDRYMKCQCPNCLKTRNKLVQVERGQVEHMDPRWSVEG